MTNNPSATSPVCLMVSVVHFSLNRESVITLKLLPPFWYIWLLIQVSFAVCTLHYDSCWTNTVWKDLEDWQSLVLSGIYSASSCIPWVGFSRTPNTKVNYKRGFVLFSGNFAHFNSGYWRTSISQGMKWWASWSPSKRLANATGNLLHSKENLILPLQIPQLLVYYITWPCLMSLHYNHCSIVWLIGHEAGVLVLLVLICQGHRICAADVFPCLRHFVHKHAKVGQGTRDANHYRHMNVR